jgi:hypothetical protein
VVPSNTVFGCTMPLSFLQTYTYRRLIGTYTSKILNFSEQHYLPFHLTYFLRLERMLPCASHVVFYGSNWSDYMLCQQCGSKTEGRHRLLPEIYKIHIVCSESFYIAHYTASSHTFLKASYSSCALLPRRIRVINATRKLF